MRELRNAIEQAAVLASGPVIGEDDLRLDGAPANAAPAEPRGAASAGLPFAEAKRRAVERFERAFLLDALRASDGNISRTAEAIGMVRQSLQQKIRELGLRDEDWRRSRERRLEATMDHSTTRPLRPLLRSRARRLRRLAAPHASAAIPARSTSRRSSERTRQYRELKEAVAGILYMRNKLEAEIHERPHRARARRTRTCAARSRAATTSSRSR